MVLYYEVMFEKLFAESGLSLDRLRTFLEVAAGGSMVKAAGGDAVRQSQYSRQIKELEEFFRTRLIERQGKLMRLTANGRELARISRFFLLGLSKYQAGCAGEKQVFRVGASGTFSQVFLAPAVGHRTRMAKGPRYVCEVAGEDEIEQKLHDLRLDFGIVSRARLSRPLQTIELGKFGVELWVPRALYGSEASARRALREKRLPLVWSNELAVPEGEFPAGQVRVWAESFLSALRMLETEELAAVLPEFLAPRGRGFLRLEESSLEGGKCEFWLGWNPRMVRLNAPTAKERDLLAELLLKEMKKGSFSASKRGNPR